MSPVTEARAREIADILDEADEAIDTYQNVKRDALATLRDELKTAGLTKAEIAVHVGGLKDAAKRLRRERVSPDAAEQDAERGELTDHYAEILSASRARSASPAREAA